MESQPIPWINDFMVLNIHIARSNPSRQKTFSYLWPYLSAALQSTKENKARVPLTQQHKIRILHHTILRVQINLLTSGTLRTRPRNGLLWVCHSIDLGIYRQLVGLATGHGRSPAQGCWPCSAGCPGPEAGCPLPQLDRHGYGVCGIVPPNWGSAGRCRAAERNVRIEPGGSKRRGLSRDAQDESQNQGQSQYLFPHENTSFFVTTGSNETQIVKLPAYVSLSIQRDPHPVRHQWLGYLHRLELG